MEQESPSPAATATTTSSDSCAGYFLIVSPIISLAVLVICFVADWVLGVIVVACVASQLFGVRLAWWVLAIGEGSQQMVSVASAIREGSEAYVRTMFGTIFMLLIPGTVVIFVLHLVQQNFLESLMVTVSFLLGACCSSFAGIIGMWSSTRANARVAQTACVSSYRNTIVVALRSGAVAGITVVSLAVLGITVLFSVCKLFVRSNVEQVPVLLVGYGFGASFVAMFAQLGGGIYTKAADVGADLCGKIEMDIPEDDPRNPAVIADLVGDNVGDCCARGADLFESLAAEIIAAMILGGSLVKNVADDGVKLRYIIFPLVVHVMDLFVSTVGVISVTQDRGQPQRGGETLADPMAVLKRGYLVAVTLAFITFVASAYTCLGFAEAPHAWIYFAACGLTGMVAGILIVYITQFYTDFTFRPVRDIAEASMSGHGTNVIAGLAVGFESAMMPILVVIWAILTTYYLGRSSGLGGSNPVEQASAGLFGTAVGTMGMLSNLTYVLAMDVFGPITDNAAGIVEMSPDCPGEARDIMDRLDAAGNTTKAFTKGFAVGSAGLACFLLFRAFLDIAEGKYGQSDLQIDIVQPEIFCGGLIGGATVLLFVAFAMHAVGSTAQEVVGEVRRQFRLTPGIVSGASKPDYARCVTIVSRAAIRKMLKPGMLVLLMPILVGGGFHLAGVWVNNNRDPLIGAKCMTSYLVCSSMTAMLVALFLNNGGGAWDNAKKYIEAGNHGGKGSDAHKAAVTGDTVGDPCKDTAGPSLHVLMKLTATVTMVMGPLICVPSKA